MCGCACEQLGVCISVCEHVLMCVACTCTKVCMHMVIALSKQGLAYIYKWLILHELIFPCKHT